MYLVYASLNPNFLLRDFMTVQIKVFSVLKGSLDRTFLLFQFKYHVDNRDIRMYYLHRCSVFA